MDKPTDPLSRFSLAVFAVNGLLTRNGDRITAGLGQSSARWQVLGRAGYEPQTVAQMARGLGHARQSVQRVADVLAADGLVAYKENPADRRAQLVELAPEGAKTVTAIYAEYHEWSRHIMRKLSDARLTLAAQLLEEIAQIMEADE